MENEISLPDRPNSPSTPPRKTQMSHESAVAIYSRMRPHEFTRGRALVQNLFLILSRPRPRKKRRIPVPRFRSLKLLVLQDSVFSKGCGGGEPFCEYFMGTAVWKNRFNRTYQRGGKGERKNSFFRGRRNRNSSSSSSSDFSWISNRNLRAERRYTTRQSLIRSSLFLFSRK